MTCDCPACKRGLYCADGELGAFERHEINSPSDPCMRCGRAASEHRR